MTTQPNSLGSKCNTPNIVVQFARTLLWATAFLVALPGGAIAQEVEWKPSLLAPFDRQTADEGNTLDPAEIAYTLGPGDALEIQLFNILSASETTAKNSNNEFLVLMDGTVNLPLVGSIKVQGLTLTEAKEQILQQYHQYAKHPFLTLRLVNPRPLKIAVFGEVYRPGSHTLPIETEQSLPSVTQALKIAGGITALADVRNIEIRRQVGAQEEVLSVNLWDLLQGGQLSQDMLLRNGDSIFIPTAKALDPEESQKLGQASFTRDAIQVYVVGEVVEPGLQEVPPNTPLNQALLASGGFLRSARKGSVELVRLNANGTAERRKIRVDFSQGVNEETNPALRNGDAIVVKRSGIANFSDTLGDVFGALRDFLIFRSFIPDGD